MSQKDSTKKDSEKIDSATRSRSLHVCDIRASAHAPESYVCEKPTRQFSLTPAGLYISASENTINTGLSTQLTVILILIQKDSSSKLQPTRTSHVSVVVAAVGSSTEEVLMLW